MAAIPIQIRQIDDRSQAIAANLVRKNGSVEEDVVLTTETITFSMYGEDGTVKVNNQSGTLVDGDADGGAQVSYSPAAADVDTAGTYYGYFHVTDGSSLVETFPTATEGFIIKILPRTN